MTEASAFLSSAVTAATKIGNDGSGFPAVNVDDCDMGYSYSILMLKRPYSHVPVLFGVQDSTAVMTEPNPNA